MGALRCHLALDETSDALTDCVVAHRSDVSRRDVAGEDPPQPRTPFGCALKFYRQQRVHVCVGSVQRCTVREVQPWPAGGRELELAARAGEWDRKRCRLPAAVPSEVSAARISLSVLTCSGPNSRSSSIASELSSTS